MKNNNAQVKLDTVMTVDQVAEFLKLSPKTIIKYSQLGKIPAMQLGKKSDWRFDRRQIENLIIDFTKKNRYA